MDKRGFTLIELLAVIIVLSIILSLAVPKIMNAIEESKKEVFKISSKALIKEAQNTYLLDNNSISGVGKTYSILNGVFVGDALSVNGDLPDSGNIFINQDGNISVSLIKDDYCVTKTFEEKEITIDKDTANCFLLVSEEVPDSCFTYTPSTTEVTITDYSITCSKNPIIPSVLGGLPVTKIGTVWPGPFANKSLTSISIPNSVTSIGNGAFEVNQLLRVTIPNSVTSIGAGAFSTNQLTNLTIPASVTSIGNWTFTGNQLVNLTLPNGLISIGDEAFYDNQLTSLIIPNNVTSIGVSAFSYNQIANITLPNGLTDIGDWAFTENQLTSVTLPSNITSIKPGIFSYNNLTSLTIPNGVTSILNFAFTDNKLTSVTLPNSIITIGRGVFNNNQLTNITIPSSVTSIDIWAFSNNLLTSLSIPFNVTMISGPDNPISETFYTSYVTVNARAAGTYTAPSQFGTWTKQP